MWRIITILVILIIICIVRKKNKSKFNINYTISDCRSDDDIYFEMDSLQKQLDDEIDKGKKIIQKTAEDGYIKIEREWLKKNSELLYLENTLYKNLEYENKRKLNKEKYKRYISLHFRSHILGELAYKEYKEAKKIRDELNQVIVEIKKNNRYISKEEKKKLYDSKDAAVNITRIMYNRMIDIQTETKKLREKIRTECGRKGKVWYRKLMQRKQRKLINI